MKKRDYPTTKKVAAFVRPDGGYRPTWEYRGVEIDGVGRKGYRIGIPGHPACVTLGEARDRIDAYHRRRAGQARYRVLQIVDALMRTHDVQTVEQPDFDDLMTLMQSAAA